MCFFRFSAPLSVAVSRKAIRHDAAPPFRLTETHGGAKKPEKGIQSTTCSWRKAQSSAIRTRRKRKRDAPRCTVSVQLQFVSRFKMNRHSIKHETEGIRKRAASCLSVYRFPDARSLARTCSSGQKLCSPHLLYKSWPTPARGFLAATYQGLAGCKEQPHRGCGHRPKYRYNLQVQRLGVS